MARMVATASLAVLLLSLLAVANCRVLEAEPGSDGASFVVAVHDEQRTPNPQLVSGEVDAAEVINPATVAVGEGFLRIPSHQRSRHPCHHGQGLFHQHLLWARHHGLPHGHGDARIDNLVVVAPTELEKKNEVQAVAEPDPDFHPDIDGEHEVEEETTKPFHGEEAEDDDELTKAWKGEMLRRIHFHHSHHLQPHHHDEEDDNKEGAAAGSVKRLYSHFHYHHDGEEKMTSKRFHRDSDREEEEQGEEEMARHWRKAIMKGRGRFHHGRRHHHHHRHAEEDEKVGGVMKWFLDVINRF